MNKGFLGFRNRLVTVIMAILILATGIYLLISTSAIPAYRNNKIDDNFAAANGVVLARLTAGYTRHGAIDKVAYEFRAQDGVYYYKTIDLRDASSAAQERYRGLKKDSPVRIEYSSKDPATNYLAGTRRTTTEIVTNGLVGLVMIAFGVAIGVAIVISQPKGVTNGSH